MAVYNQAICRADFKTYLKALSLKHKKRPLALFMDQLAVHKAADVRELYAELNITQIFNVGYSPELNPIESVFSRVKAIFNRQRLNCLVNKIGFNFDATIRTAFEAIQ